MIDSNFKSMVETAGKLAYEALQLKDDDPQKQEKTKEALEAAQRLWFWDCR